MDNQNSNKTLFLDIGNSSLKWMIGAKQNSSAMAQQQYPENISSEFFKQCWQSLELEQPKSIFVSCVAENSVFDALTKACNELWGLSVQRVVSAKQGFGLINAYDDAITLGSDRWCAMIAAQTLSDSAFMVVDAGSALTLDLVDAYGQHLGGYIAPGLGMMKKSLGLNTAQVKLDSTENSLPSLSLANSTTSCVEAGVYLSAVKLIEAVFENESRQTAKLECYLTGGDAKSLAALLPFKCVIIPELVLQGLAVIAAQNNKD